MRDYEIRAALRNELRGLHEGDADALIIEELGLCTGTARVDMAVINSSITGYEIKSDQDTLSRLPGQIEVYSRALDYVTVVACPAHVEKIVRLVPAWFGITEAQADGAAVALQRVRAGRKNPSVDPYALVQLLWRDEALSLLREFGLERGVKSKPRAAIWRRLADARPVEELGRRVRHQLRSRAGWRTSGQAAGSQV